MRLLVCLLALCALPALAGDAPPPPPPPPPSGDSPTTDSPSTTPSNEPPAVEAKARTNWAKPAAFIGFGAGGAVFVLSIVAGIIGTGVYENADGAQFFAGSYLMLLPLVITGAAGPIVFVGGSTARWTKSITGSRALRYTGWISYGVALVAELSAIFVGGWLPFAAGIIGAGSLTCFGVDALFSANDAADVAEMASSDGVRFGPTVSLLPGVNGRGGGGAVIGMSGAF